MPSIEIHPILKKTGFKPTETFKHEFIRCLFIAFLIGLVCWSIYNEYHKSDDVSIDELSHIIKPGSIMYDSINEMEPDHQKKYIATLKNALSDTPSVFAKYMKSLQVALIAGIASEYSVHGNLSKPMGIISKTIFYTLVNTMMTS